MKIASIHLQNFKRFTELKIENIPATAKLVVLLGAHGSGKSSVFDALHCKSYESGRTGHQINSPNYHTKAGSQGQQKHRIDVNFHDVKSSKIEAKAIYTRTAYRNEPLIKIDSIQKMPLATRENRFSYMIQNDVAVGLNYQRLITNSIGYVHRTAPPAETVKQVRDKTLGEIQAAMKRLFGDLTLNNLGDPFNEGTFTFNKGVSTNFDYLNLSSGEKGTFDLLLDIFVKRVEYDDTVFCIDEPETHISPKLQGALLEELLNLINDKSQLWIATHGIGIMRKALQLYKQHGEKVVFLDFSNQDFDSQEEVVIEPTKPSRRFWEQTHEIALDDLAALVVPDQIVICEGKQGDKGLDAECYNQIFSEEFPNTKFISAGGKRDLQNYISVVGAVTEGATIFGLRDLDQATHEEVIRLQQEGIRVLQGKIEDYLLADDVLGALCQYYGLEPYDEKVDELIALRKNIPDIKKAADQIRRQVIAWGVSGAGDSREGFLRDTVASRIKPGMLTYEKLKQIIFGQ